MMEQIARIAGQIGWGLVLPLVAAGLTMLVLELRDRD